MAGATLRIENGDGPVTIYVDGDLAIQNAGRVVTDDGDPEKFAVYLASGSTARFTNESDLHGVVHGPDAHVEVDDDGVFAGALVGATTVIKGGGEVIYTEALHANVCPADPLPLDVPPVRALLVADLAEGSDVELALVDANGCRSWRTVMVPVPEASTGLAALVACAALALLQRTRSA